MAMMRRVSRDLVIAGVLQFGALLFGATILDMGEFNLATRRISAAYWFVVIIVLIRRHNLLTRGDHFFLRYGLLTVLTLGIPITLTVWAFRGVI